MKQACIYIYIYIYIYYIYYVSVQYTYIYTQMFQLYRPDCPDYLDLYICTFQQQSALEHWNPPPVFLRCFFL